MSKDEYCHHEIFKINIFEIFLFMVKSVHLESISPKGIVLESNIKTSVLIKDPVKRHEKIKLYIDDTIVLFLF